MPKPPNLREAHECGDCRFFDGKGQCMKYRYPVEDDEVCDAWAPASTREASKRLWAKHRRRLAKEA